MPLAAAETKVGIDAKAATAEVGVVNVEVEEDEVADTWDFREINPQVVDIESSYEIRGTIIVEEEPFAKTREVSTLLMPQRKKKR